MVNEKELIHQFKTGSAVNRERAFKMLMDENKERVYWVCRRMLKSHEDANDVTQNVFLKVYKSLDRFHEDARFFTWVYRIATNESINAIRSKKLRHTVGLDSLIQEPAGNESQPIESLKSDETKNDIKEAILSLPEKQREVFMMRYYDELSYEEIAAILKTSVGGLKANYFHAFKKIEAFLKQRLNHEV